ncbi:hypothetical protein [Citricoccus nitrophenolicus]|uniref:hypothetical protein n=1 Tax=Citricoccus nitrophenolicus TaxID=863575 RepID=UPI0039B5DCB2
MAVILTVLMVCAVIGIPASFFVDPSPMMVFYRILAVPGVLFAGYGAWYYINGALRPQHVTIDDLGVSTPGWALAWDEIRDVRIEPAEFAAPRKQQLAFSVTEEAFQRVRQANRAHSGRPFHMGGLLSRTPVVRTQFDTNPTPFDLFPIFDDRLRNRPPGI